jgi:TetR/AcrR family transcriptional repressor of nem operon
MVGPSKQFDRDEALGRALEVFWARGFEATSMQDLVDHMGINRASMYDTFGNKHALFSQAVDWYVTQVLGDFARILEAPGSPLGNIRRYFKTFQEQAHGPRHHGCFINNTAVELGPHDPEIAEKIRSVWRQMEALFQAALDRAVQAGELGSNADTRALARLLNTTVQGLAVKGKAGVPPAQLTDVVRTLFSLLQS